MSVELAPYFVPFMCVATSIRAGSTANDQLQLVNIVQKEMYSGSCNLHLQLRCHSFVSVLMRPDLGWSPAPHLTSQSYVPHLIQLLERDKGPSKSVRIVGKDTASKPCGHSRWSRSYKLVSDLMRPDFWAAASTTTYLLVVCGGCNIALRE